MNEKFKVISPHGFDMGNTGLYYPEKDKICFAVEETAAVPTGNQALQRCERLYTQSLWVIDL